MDRLRSRAHGGVDHLGDVQVALARRGGSQPDGRVGLEHMPRRGIGVAVHGDRSDAQPAQGPHHPHRDLAAVGYQYRVEHLYIRKTP